MNDTECVRAFMEATSPDQVLPELGMHVPEWVRVLRARLVLSEALELCEALGVDVYTNTDVRFGAKGFKITTDADVTLEVSPVLGVDLVEVADACADLRYVVVGTEVAFAIPGDAVFAEVHRSNMTKLDPETGEAILDSGGKVLKPPTYSRPDVVGVLARCVEESRS